MFEKLMFQKELWKPCTFNLPSRVFRKLFHKFDSSTDVLETFDASLDQTILDFILTHLVTILQNDHCTHNLLNKTRTNLVEEEAVAKTYLEKEAFR